MNASRINGFTGSPAAAATNAANAAVKNSGTSNIMNSVGSVMGRFWFVFLLILIVFVGCVVYYKTVGYYLEFSWQKIWTMIKGGDSVDMDIEDTVEASLKPMDLPQPMAPADERPLGMPGATDPPNFLKGLNIGGPQKEVFNVSRNIYTFNDATAVCAAFDAEVATYDQLENAYKNGADWCNYGWTKGQMAIYPTQKATYEKLQKGAPEYRNACGHVGLNGGYFDNPDLRFGVNCFGMKPARNANDELAMSEVQLPSSPAELEFEKRVQKFREQLSTTTVLPFRRGQWTE
jgi:hypothetical protein